MPYADRWHVDRVELISPDTTTVIRGGAWLRGEGVRAYCSMRDLPVEAVLDVHVGEWGQLYTSAVSITSSHSAKSDVEVTSALMRTCPIQRLMHAAFASLDEDIWRAQRATDAPRQVDAVVAAWRTVQGTSDAYRATAAVAERLSLSRGHVSRLLTQARREGLIPRKRAYSEPR